MAKKEKKPPPPTGGLNQNAFEKRICNCICGLQLVSILSGVALLYLSVIVVLPSKRTLDAEFSDVPYVCTTLQNASIRACDWLSCGEWCLSKGGSCQQIHAKVRRPGSDVTFEECEDVSARFCSAQEYDQTQNFTCSMGDEKVGECDFLDGFMSCVQVENTADDINIKSVNTSMCRNITAISDCSASKSGPASSPPTQSRTITCSRYTCNDLQGTYECKHGTCLKLDNPECQDRCSGLRMKNLAVVVPDHFHWARCGRALINGTTVWTDRERPLAVYCSRISNTSDSVMHAEDCFNGTLVPSNRFSRITTYKQILQLLTDNAIPLSDSGDYLAGEMSMEVYNSTRVMINIEGCVNTLQKECTRWLQEKGRDGSDGMHPSVYPCIITPHSDDYVITNYDRENTAFYMLLACILPFSLLVVSCFLLCLCSKIVSVNEFGLFYCKSCHKLDPGGKEN